MTRNGDFNLSLSAQGQQRSSLFLYKLIEWSIHCCHSDCLLPPPPSPALLVIKKQNLFQVPFRELFSRQTDGGKKLPKLSIHGRVFVSRTVQLTRDPETTAGKDSC